MHGAVITKFRLLLSRLSFNDSVSWLDSASSVCYTNNMKRCTIITALLLLLTASQGYEPRAGINSGGSCGGGWDHMVAVDINIQEK
jgi:hypothetical protein